MVLIALFIGHRTHIDPKARLVRGISLLLPFISVSAFALIKSYRLITDVVERFGLQLDALANDESNSWHLARQKVARLPHSKTTLLS